MTTAAALKRVSLFAGAGDDDLTRLADWAEKLSFAEGDLLLRAGDPADRLLVLTGGLVVLSLPVPGRGGLMVETLGPGDVVGLSWALPRPTWTLDARAQVDSEALSIPASRIQPLIDADDSLGQVVRHGLIGLLDDRLHATRLRLLDLYRHELES